MRLLNPSAVLALLCLLPTSVVCFQPPLVRKEWPSPSTALHMNFFQDMLGKAFENDQNLSQGDTRDGQIDGAEVPEEEQASSLQTLTATQEKWRQQQLDRTTVEAELLQDTTIQLDLFLTGVPNKDPSNDLFGSRVSISARDRDVGLAIPETPTVSNLELTFLADGKCQCRDKKQTGFLQQQQQQQQADGDWVLSQDGTQVRFRIQVAGYTRRVETKGTIQKVFWSNEDEKSSQTSTVYSIPPGWLYGETQVSRNAATQRVQWEKNGVLKVEQSMGLLGSASKMTPCGKFEASVVGEYSSSSQ